MTFAALALVGSIAVIAVPTLWSSGGKAPQVEPVVSTPQDVTSTSSPAFSDPSGGPLFGEQVDVVLVFDGGYDSVLALDPDTRRATRSLVEGQRPGDQPYRITAVGDHLVVGWGVVSASHMQTGERTILGEATIYVPAAEPGLVWLVDWTGDHIGQGGLSVWQVNMEGENATEPTEIGIEGYPAIGVPGGLAVETDDGIRLWYPEDGATDRRIGEQSAFVIDAAGDLLAYCPDQSCKEIDVVDLVTLRTVRIARNDSSFVSSGRFSPDGSQLAIASATGVELADSDSGQSVTIADGFGTVDLPLFVAWSPDGRQLFAATYGYGESQTTLVRYSLDSGAADVVTVPFGGGGLDFVVLPPMQGEHYLRRGEVVSMPG